MVTRRDFLTSADGVPAAAVVCSGCRNSPLDDPILTPNTQNPRQPNISLVLVDEMRQPPISYGPNEGDLQSIEEILGFESEISPNNPFSQSSLLLTPV